MNPISELVRNDPESAFTDFGISSTGCLNCGHPEVQFCSQRCMDTFAEYLHTEATDEEMAS
jgi:hypothetical protein